MYRKRIMFGILALSVIGLIAGALVGKAWGTDTGDPFSAQPDSNLGAWYDETWAATGFYRLESDPAVLPTAQTYHYQYTTTATTVTAPIFTMSTAALLQAIPQDMVVTEWRATGHVHFKSEI